MLISEVSSKFSISADTLRYYERIGLLPPVHRKENGLRDYTEVDCRWVEFILCMRAASISIETLIEYVTLFQQGIETVHIRKALLIEQREKLAIRVAEMQTALDRLDKKIENYEERMIQREHDLQLW